MPDEPKKGREINPVAEMENWKAACSKQTAVAKNFHENWGYLRARPEECKPRAFETRLVKYFSSGVASVREKRLALEGEARGDTPATPPEEKVQVDPELLAKQVARSMFQTTAYEYGSRGSLELFGVSQHGVKATITKPGGGGTARD